MLKRASLGAKLTGGFAVAAVIALLTGLIGYRGIVSAKHGQDGIAAEQIPSVIALLSVSGAMTDVSRVERDLVMPGIGAEEFNRQKADYRRYLDETEQAIKSFDAVPKTGEEEADWKEFKGKYEAWKKVSENVYALAVAGNQAAAFSLSNGDSKRSFRAARDGIGKGVDHQKKDIEKAGREFDASANRAMTFTVVSMFLGVAVSLALGIFLSRSISGALKKTMASLSEGAVQVAAAATQLSSSSQSLADGSSEQAASLEETASAMEEMSAMTRSNSDSAGQARTLSERAGASVDKANASMGRLVGQMSEISSMGEEIGKIIRTIDEIAFQTNLLALNAAVEAARAGEAGAGFAVVADEVRNLAQRAAGAAKNTSELIEGSIRKIKDGTALVEQTNTDFSEVTSSVKKVAELVAEVSAASSEQERGIQQVSTTVTQMDRVTQANAASAEEIASASEEMNAQALSLQEIVQGMASLVAGEENRTIPGGAAARSQVSPPKGAGRRAPAEAAPRASLAPAPAARKGGNGKGYGGASADPESLIPLEEKSMEEF